MESILRKVSILTASGILVTLVSGVLLLVRTVPSIPDLPYFDYYGLPLAWRQVVLGGFINRGATSTVFWFPFLLDVLFYMAIGYVLMVPYQAKRAGWKLKSLPLLLAAGYAVSVTAYAVWLYNNPPPVIP